MIGETIFLLLQLVTPFASSAPYTPPFHIRNYFTEMLNDKLVFLYKHNKKTYNLSYKYQN